jgi:predicted transcriptional regulator
MTYKNGREPLIYPAAGLSNTKKRRDLVVVLVSLLYRTEKKKNNPKKKNVDRSSNHDVSHTFRSCIADTLMRTAPREKKKKEKKKKKLMTTQKRKKLLDDTPISTSTLRLVDAK